MPSKNYALIIIDMQNDIVLPDAPACVKGAYPTVPVIKKALDFFRDKKYPVFHVIRQYRADGSDVEINRLKRFQENKPYVVPGTKGAEIVDELKPETSDYVIVKNRFSAFMNTELDFMLRRLKVDEIVICGTQYPNCIRASVFDGVCFGYPVTVLTDATSAATPEIAEANITDMKNIGVRCVEVAEFMDKCII